MVLATVPGSVLGQEPTRVEARLAHCSGGDARDPDNQHYAQQGEMIPRGRCMGRIERGIAGTGTLVLALPAAPSISKWTCHEPEAINQSDPVKKAGSAAEGCMASELGGCFAASPVSGVGVTRME